MPNLTSSLTYSATTTMLMEQFRDTFLGIDRNILNNHGWVFDEAPVPPSVYCNVELERLFGYPHYRQDLQP